MVRLTVAAVVLLALLAEYGFAAEQKVGVQQQVGTEMVVPADCMSDTCKLKRALAELVHKQQAQKKKRNWELNW